MILQICPSGDVPVQVWSFWHEVTPAYRGWRCAHIADDELAARVNACRAVAGWPPIPSSEVLRLAYELYD